MNRDIKVTSNDFYVINIELQGEDYSKYVNDCLYESVCQ